MAAPPSRAQCSCFGIFPGFLPPLSPTMTAEQVAAFYRDHAGQVRASMILLNVVGIGFIPFFMVMAGLAFLAVMFIGLYR